MFQCFLGKIGDGPWLFIRGFASLSGGVKDVLNFANGGKRSNFLTNNRKCWSCLGVTKDQQMVRQWFRLVVKL